MVRRFSLSCLYVDALLSVAQSSVSLELTQFLQSYFFIVSVLIRASPLLWSRLLCQVNRPSLVLGSTGGQWVCMNIQKSVNLKKERLAYCPTGRHSDLKSAHPNHINFLEHWRCVGRIQGSSCWILGYLPTGLFWGWRFPLTLVHGHMSHGVMLQSQIILLLLKRLWVKYTSSDFLFSRFVLLSGSSEKVSMWNSPKAKLCY